MNTLRLAIAAIFAVSGWVLSDVAQAQSGAETLKAKGCNNCHDAEKKKVGPSYKDIAAKKAKTEDLTAKITSAKGHPKVNATEAEVKTAVEQIQSTK